MDEIHEQNTDLEDRPQKHPIVEQRYHECYYCLRNNNEEICPDSEGCNMVPKYYEEWNADVDCPPCPNCNDDIDVTPYRFPERWECDNCGWTTPIIKNVRR